MVHTFVVLILRQDLIKLPRETLKLWSSCLSLLVITSLCYQAWLLQAAKLNKLLLHSRQLQCGKSLVKKYPVSLGTTETQIETEM